MLATVTQSNRPPVASAGGPYSGNAGATLAFSAAASSDPDGDSLTFVWNFGDGATGSGAAPTHVYAAAGTYTATVTVTDGRGGSATATAAVTIGTPPPPNRPPVAALAAPADAFVGDAVTLDGRGSSDPDQDPLAYSWTFGDGATTPGGPALLTHTYTTPGIFTISLVVADGHGGTDTATTTLRIAVRNAPPLVSAGPARVITLPAGATLTGAVTDDGLPAGSVVTLAWSKVSGPGLVIFAAPAAATTTATFSLPGAYVLRLTASDSLLASTSDVAVTVNVNGAPVARPGGPYAAATLESMTFDGTASSDPEQEALIYTWSFGDGTTGTGPTPAHAYAAADTYTVTLTVRDPQGNTGTATVLATVTQGNQPPVAHAGGPYSGDAGAALAFSAAASSDPDGDSLTFAWDFGDGGSAAGAAPTHAYLGPGTYTVTLSVSDSHAHSATASTSAVIVPAQDRAPPAVALFGAREALPGTDVLMTASATDNVGVTAVTFEVNGGAPTTSLQAPYERHRDDPEPGQPRRDGRRHRHGTGRRGQYGGGARVDRHRRGARHATPDGGDFPAARSFAWRHCPSLGHGVRCGGRRLGDVPERHHGHRDRPHAAV